MRLAADFDNFKKRSRRELTDAAKISREDVLRALLPVFDGLERARAHATDATSVAALTEGIQMVMREFTDTLGKLGVERIASVGADVRPSLPQRAGNGKSDGMVGVRGFEPPTPASRTQYSTRLSYTPT